MNNKWNGQSSRQLSTLNIRPVWKIMVSKKRYQWVQQILHFFVWSNQCFGNYIFATHSQTIHFVKNAQINVFGIHFCNKFSNYTFFEKCSNQCFGIHFWNKFSNYTFFEKCSNQCFGIHFCNKFSKYTFLKSAQINVLEYIFATSSQIIHFLKNAPINVFETTFLQQTLKFYIFWKNVGGG